MRHIIAIALLVTLASCARTAPTPAGSLADEAHSVDEYYGDAKLSAETIEACKGRNSAEQRMLDAKTACKNVQESETRHAREEWNKAVDGGAP